MTICIITISHACNKITNKHEHKENYYYTQNFINIYTQVPYHMNEFKSLYFILHWCLELALHD